MTGGFQDHKIQIWCLSASQIAPCFNHPHQQRSRPYVVLFYAWRLAELCFHVRGGEFSADRLEVKFAGLTSALPSGRRAAESAASSSSRTQDLMVPPSPRSRKRPAGHLAPRRPIPRPHRVSSPCRVLAACARHALLNIRRLAARPSVCSRWVTRRLDVWLCPYLCFENSPEKASRIPWGRCVVTTVMVHGAYDRTVGAIQIQTSPDNAAERRMWENENISRCEILVQNIYEPVPQRGIRPRSKLLQKIVI